MRKVLLGSFLVGSLIATGACKKSDDKLDRAAKQVEKATENVDEQKKDVVDETKDVAKEQKDLNEEQRDVAKQTNELREAQADLSRAKDNYVTAARTRMSTIDAKLHELEVRADQKSKDKAAELRARRDTLFARMNSIDVRTSAEWNTFRTDVDDKFDSLEKDIDNALH